MPLGTAPQPAEGSASHPIVIQPVTPEPPRSSPPAAPSAAVLSEAARPAPQAAYYVAKYFSVVTDTGIHGFPAGKQVTLIKEMGNALMVSDGVIRVTAPRSSFTNDPSLAQSSAQQSVAAPPPVTEAQAQAQAREATIEKSKRLLAARAAERAAEKNAALRVQKKQQLQADVADLTNRIKLAEKEIADKKSSQRPIRRTYDAWGNLISYQGRSMYTLSPDASNLDRLIGKRDKLEQDLADLHD